MSKTTPIAVIVLAAGKGTRMRSDLPKVLHKAAGRSLLGHVLHSANAAKPERTVVISGPEMPEVGAEAKRVVPQAVIAIQEKRQGTGHAVGIAKDGLKGFFWPHQRYPSEETAAETAALLARALG